MSTVLVTGGAGFIGSHIVDSLIKDGHKVVVMDDLSGGFTENVHPKAINFRGDVSNPADVDFPFRRMGPIDYVIHAAAYAAEGLSHFIRGFNYRNNLIGSTNLINQAVRHNVKGFVFLSSIAVYGHRPAPFRERDIPLPCDPYGVAKYAVELDLRAAAEQFGLRSVVFRPHNVYGERQNIADPYRNVIGIFMRQCLEGKPMSVFGDGQQSRAFSYISDVAPVIASVIGRDHTGDAGNIWGGTFNIGASTPCTVLHLAEEVALAMKVPFHVEHLPDRNEVTIAWADHGELLRVFPAAREPQVDLAAGLARMAAWVRTQRLRPTRPFREIEINTNMPPAWAKLINP